MGDIALKGNKLTKKDVRKHYEEVKAAFPEDFKRKKPARTRKMGGGRTNLLEELGRVEGERSNPNRRAEISRVHGELNRGYAKGGRIGLKHGGPPTRANKRLGIPGALGRGKVPTKEALQRMLARRRDFQTHGKDVPTMAAKGGRIGLKHGTKPDWKKGKFGKKTIAAMKKHDFPAGGPHQSLEGKKAALQHASIRAREHKAEGGRIGLKKGGSDKNWIQKATKGMVKTKPCTGKKFGSKSCPPGSKRYNLAKTFKKMGRERKAKG